MRYIRFITSVFLAALVAVGLSACDFSEQNYEIEPGDELQIEGPGSVDVPAGEASFYIIPFTIEKEYSWSVDGPSDVSTSIRRDGEYLDVIFEEPGHYTINIESSGQGEEYSGSLGVEAAYPDVGTQSGRFSALIAAYGTSGFASILDNDDRAPYTVLAPTGDALISAFGEDEGGDPDLPTSTVLEDLVEYHTIPDSLEAADLGPQESSLIDGVDVTIDANSIEDSDISASNGLVHTLDEVFEPPFAIVDFIDQEAGVDEDSDAQTVTVASVYLPDVGFVVIEDEDGDPVSAVSDELDSGFYNDITLELDGDVTEEEEYSAAVYQDSNLTMPHEDRDGDDAADSAAVVPPAAE